MLGRVRESHDERMRRLLDPEPNFAPTAGSWSVVVVCAVAALGAAWLLLQADGGPMEASFARCWLPLLIGIAVMPGSEALEAARPVTDTAHLVRLARIVFPFACGAGLLLAASHFRPAYYFFAGWLVGLTAVGLWKHSHPDAVNDLRRRRRAR